MECDSENKKCCNSQAYRGERKILDKDVIEALTWGLDSYTRKNIFFLLHELYPVEEKHTFIEKSILKAANLLGRDGCYMY